MVRSLHLCGLLQPRTPYNRVMKHARCPYKNLLDLHLAKGTPISDVDFAMLGASLGG